MESIRNLSLLCDFYELTMGNGYLLSGIGDKISYFDVFFRSVPDGGGFAIAAGLEQVVEYIENLHFDDSDIDYLLAGVDDIINYELSSRANDI